MDKIETKKKNCCKKREDLRKKPIRNDSRFDEIERYYSVFGYHDCYLEEPESIKGDLISRFRIVISRFFSWALLFLNSFPL